MKKKILIAVIVIILLVLLIPIPMRLKDGGTIEYKALIYTCLLYTSPSPRDTR